MVYLILGVMFFGLTHPLGKLLLGFNSLPLNIFVLVFIFFRIVAQLPIVIFSKNFRVQGKDRWFLLFLLGGVGAGLHFSEFKSLTIGLSVPTVTFLIFTHPIWTQLYRIVVLKEALTASKAIRIVGAIVGIIFIVGPEAAQLSFDLRVMIPLISSLAFSAWVILSERGQKLGISTIALAFYYDLFSFAILSMILFFSPDHFPVSEILGSFNFQVIVALFSYAVIVGVLANYLFYVGVKATGSGVAAYALLLEPVMSAAVSTLLFQTQMDASFIFGAGVILLVNLPDKFFKRPSTAIQERV